MPHVEQRTFDILYKSHICKLSTWKLSLSNTSVVLLYML